MKYKSILVISDLHAPYMHPDTVEFLAAVSNKYKPDLVVSVGDEIDGHSWSMHTSSTELNGPAQELNSAILALRPLYQMFPMVHVVDSNHGSLAIRKGQLGQIPNAYLKSNKEALEAPSGWHWYPHLDVTMSNNQKVRFIHHIGVNSLKCAMDIGMNLVMGHTHTKLESHVQYSHTLKRQIFGMHVGCLVDNKSLAFAYNRTTSKEPAIGCGVIIDGIPIPLSMIRDENNRWIGRRK